MPTLTDSRQGPGKLELGGTDYGVQISNVRLTPNHDTSDGTPTLGIPKPAQLVTTNWELAGSAIQDWEDPEGFTEYCRANNVVEVAFSWIPNDDLNIKYSGTCQVVAVEIGGDIATQSTTDWVFSVVGDPVRTIAL